MSKQADVGVTLLEDTCENHRLAFPTRCSSTSRLKSPVLASDLPELRGLVTALGVGRLDGPPPRARAQIAARRIVAAPRGAGAAGPSVAWSTDSAILVGLYAQLALRLKR